MDRTDLTARLKQAANGAEFLTQKQVCDCMGWKKSDTAQKHLAGIDVYRFGTRKLYSVVDLSKHLTAKHRHMGS